MTRIVLSGGGTAGHLHPALALGEELLADTEDWAGSALRISKKLLLESLIIGRGEHGYLAAVTHGALSSFGSAWLQRISCLVPTGK